jgi:hypothetical protein
MGVLDPTKTRLSPHFLLSDMMGCDSVYTQGHPNVFNKTDGFDLRLANGKALCHEALEPILALVGSFSISYGFISPSLSREIVTYQDWRKPSHHRWDLGAAVDICPHAWVQSLAPNVTNTDSPIEFALTHLQDLPISRLITYSESPYFCVAVSEEEVRTSSPRMAWYENRYTGKRGAKPDYRKYPSQAARERALARLQADGLDHDWQGRGFPTYHGGGRKQLHHVRTSKYTMMSDWLYDKEWVSEGVKNVPSVMDANVMEAFHMAGDIYDTLLEVTGIPRFSIVSGYTSPRSPGWIENHDWRGDIIEFELVPPEYTTPQDVVLSLLFGGWPSNTSINAVDDRLVIRIER